METDEVSELIVRVADQVILPRFGHLATGDIHEKHPGDPVTIADREAEAQLGAALAARTPDALIIGEEAVFTDPGLLDSLGGAAHAWVIDPVDGTRNFTRSSPDFGVMVAELVHGETARGWIYQPMHGHMYIAERGAGVRLDGEPFAAVRPRRARIFGTTDFDTRRPELVDIRRPWGACAIDYTKLCAGDVDFYVCRSAHVWDHLPGALLVTELGGRVATELGEDYRPGVTGRRVIAAASASDWKLASDAIFGDAGL